MKKILIAILLSGGLFLTSSIFTINTNQKVFAQSACTHNGECINNQLCYCPAGGTVCEDGHVSFVFDGECGDDTVETNIQLNIGQVAKDKGIVGTTNYEPEDGAAGFGALMGQILRIVVTVAALMLFIYLLWGGLGWITAGGDKGKVEAARNRITQSIIGMIVLAGTIALFSIMQSALNFQVFNFTGGSNTGDGSGSGSSACTITGQMVNDGGNGNYCTNGGAAMVKCIAPEGIYQSNHYTPCYCVDGVEFNRADLNFGLCN